MGRAEQLEAEVGRALAVLDFEPGEPARDGWIDPAQLLAWPAGGAALVRMARPLEAAGDEGYAAEPADPLWVRLEIGDRRVRWTPMTRARAGEGTATRVLVRRRSEPCCDAAKCLREKVAAEVVIDAGEELVACEILVDDERDVEVADRVAAALEGVLGLRPAPAPRPEVELLSAVELGRWSLRRERDVFVIRDHARDGPRRAARGEWLLAALLGAVTVALGAWAWQAYARGARDEAAVVAVAAVVLAVIAYGAACVARWSSRYRGTSEALAAAARDRLVVAPWTSRSGAVDVRPEGRYGAGLAVAGIEGVRIERARGLDLVCDSDHGPFGIGTLATEAQAGVWLGVLERVLERVRHQPPAGKPPAAARGSTTASARLAVLLAVVAACDGAVPEIPPPPPPRVSASAPPSAVPSASEVAALPPKIVIVEDDIEAATKLARAEGKALFVEVWAPWCHTCLSMKSFVLPDPAVAPLGARVVFAAVDSDRDANAAFMARYAVSVWPTLFVIDPAAGEVLGMWQGSASVRELRRFITEAADLRDARLDAGGPAAALLAASRAQAVGDFAAAAAGYRTALERGGAKWTRRADALMGLGFCLYRLGRFAECAKLGLAEVATISGAAVPADFAWVTLTCADKLKDAALQKRAREAAVARLKVHTSSPPADANIDDRSDALGIYAGGLRALGRKDEAAAAVLAQIELLEAAAKAAPTPQVAATFDYARMNAYLSVGMGERAVAMLTERAKQLPHSYEPPSRLAQVLMALGRHPEARAPLERAITLSYGPRRVRYLVMRADLCKKLGDKPCERAAVAQAIEATKLLPPTPHDQERRAAELRALLARHQRLAL